MPLAKALLKVGGSERIIHLYICQFGSECGVAAMVAPVSVKDTKAQSRWGRDLRQ